MQLLKTLLRWLMGILFIAAGVNHFWHPAFYTNIMPNYLPWHLELVYASGIVEIVLGVLLLVPRYQNMAAWGIIALLVVFLTVHIHMLVNAHQYPTISNMFLWVRLLLQFPLIAWAYWYTRRGVQPFQVTSTDKVLQ